MRCMNNTFQWTKPEGVFLFLYIHGNAMVRYGVTLDSVCIPMHTLHTYVVCVCVKCVTEVLCLQCYNNLFVSYLQSVSMLQSIDFWVEECVESLTLLTTFSLRCLQWLITASCFFLMTCLTGFFLLLQNRKVNSIYFAWLLIDSVFNKFLFSDFQLFNVLASVFPPTQIYKSGKASHSPLRAITRSVLCCLRSQSPTFVAAVEAMQRTQD